MTSSAGEATGQGPGVALVTGAARRIGAAIARDLASGGWAVAIHANSAFDAADTLAESLRGNGCRAAALAADLSDETQTAALLPAAEDALGPVTLLINNASLFERDEVDTVTRASWDAHMSVNLRAPLILTQALATRLPADRSGCVVNLLDQRVWNLTPHFVSYTVSKSALWTLTRTLALALAPRVRVNGIGPGPTMRNSRQTEEHFASQWQATPLAHPVGVEEICAALKYLVEAQSVTGQMIAVDAGEHLGWAQPKIGVVPKE